jgi:transcription initiation factor IIE alpha subunit
MAKEKTKIDPTRLMLAYLCIATEGPEASLVRKVAILDRFNLTDEEIAKVCGNTTQSVRNARQFAKKKR